MIVEHFEKEKKLLNFWIVYFEEIVWTVLKLSMNSIEIVMGSTMHKMIHHNNAGFTITVLQFFG